MSILSRFRARRNRARGYDAITPLIYPIPPAQIVSFAELHDLVADDLLVRLIGDEVVRQLTEMLRDHPVVATALEEIR